MIRHGGWTELARCQFFDAINGYWPPYKGQEAHRANLLGLIEEQVSAWPITTVLVALKHLKITEQYVRFPSIPKILEAVKALGPRMTAQNADPEPQGISWRTFCLTNDWRRFIAELRAKGRNVAWIEKNYPKWMAGAPLLPALAPEKLAEPPRMREPGED